MVRKLTPLLLALLLVAPALSAQRQIRLTVAFYKQEEIYDLND